MTARNPRICADCRHCEQRRTLLVLTEEYCSHPKAVDLVTGKAVWRARQLRDPGSRLCGASGRLWEAKEAFATTPREWATLTPARREYLRGLQNSPELRPALTDDAIKQYRRWTKGLRPDPVDERVDGYGVPADWSNPVGAARRFAKAIKEARE